MAIASVWNKNYSLSTNWN